MPRHWVNSVEDFEEFLSVVWLCAPDEFFKEDWRKEDEQLDLEKAFVELERGLGFLKEKIKDDKKIAILEQLLKDIMDAYRVSDIKNGAKLVQEMQMKAFGRI